MPTLHIGKTSSPVNYLTKDFIGTDFPVTLKYPTSVFNPTVLLQMTINQEKFDWNYAMLEFDDADKTTKYYFVTDIIPVSNTLVEIHLKEDVLETYANDILNNEPMVIERSSSGKAMDRFIYDPIIPKEYIKKNKFFKVPSLDHHSPVVSNSGVTKFLDGFESDSDGVNYVVVVTATGDPLALNAGIGQMPTRNNLLHGLITSSDTPSVYIYCCAFQTMQALVEWVGKNPTDSQSLVAMYHYPYAVPHESTALSTIRFNKKDVSTGSEAEKSTYYAVDFNTLLLGDFDWYIGTYEYEQPDSWEYGDVAYTMYLPYVGNISVPPEMVDYGDEIQIVYIPYYASNECLVAVCDVTKNMMIYSTVVSIATEIPMTQSNAQTIRDTWTKLGIQTSVALVADTIKLMFGGNLSKLSAVKSIASNTSGLVTTALTTHEQTSVNVASANAGNNLLNYPYLIVTYPEYTIDWNADRFITQYGVPAMKVVASLSQVQLDSNEVFVKCNCSYLTSINATETEQREIIRLLNEGIVLPPKTSS